VKRSDPLAVKLRIIGFKLESEIVKRLCRLLGLRPSSGPFLSGDSYRRLARHRYESGKEAKFLTEKVEPGDLVFCEAGKLPEFLLGPAGRIQHPFVLISSNGDLNIGRELIRQIPNSVGHWFAQNLNIAGPKISPLPIGLENRHLHTNGVVRDFVALRNRRAPKVTRILYGFAVVTNPTERTGALEALRISPLAQPLPNRLSARLYREVVVKYRFVASPEGNGLDCHRTWEAMYLGAVPIVRRSAATERFFEMGLPLLLIDQWSEIASWSEEKLDFFYEERKSGLDHPALWLDYWKAAFLAASCRLV